jgi:Domain of unknown function (DUF4149)
VLRDRLTLMAVAFWWGSLCATGFIVVPLLFLHLPTPAMAGQMAARLFSAQCWVAMGCGLFLLMARHRPSSGSEAPPPMEASLLLVSAGLLLALLLEFGAAPRIAARDNLRLWHALGSALYVLQWLCAGALLWRHAGAHSRQ